MSESNMASKQMGAGGWVKLWQFVNYVSYWWLKATVNFSKLEKKPGWRCKWSNKNIMMEERVTTLPIAIALRFGWERD